MKAADLYKLIRKPMPKPSRPMGEGKKRNPYSRKQKFKKNWRNQLDF